MLSMRRALVRRSVVAAAAGSVRFQGGRPPRGGPRGGAPPQGGGMSPQEQRMMQEQQAMQQMQRMQAQGEADAEAEDEAPAPPPKKPETSKFTKVEIRPDGVAVVKMARAPVNSLSLEFFTELADWLMWLSTEEAGCRALVLSSDIPTVFSAGVDITELYKPQADRFTQFWLSFQEIWLILNSYPKPVIAAVNGNAPAGGCILSLCCDFRVMARASMKDPSKPKPYRIGLNETKLGIIAPPWVMKSLTYVVGERKAEKMLQLGETPTADEALAIGLVDRVVEEQDVMEAALQEAARFMAVPAEARWMSKDMMRRDLMQFFPSEAERQYDVEFFTALVQNPEVEASVGKYLERLGSGKKKQQ